MALYLEHDGCFIGDGKDEKSNWKLGSIIAESASSKVSQVIDVKKRHTEQCVVKQIFISDDTDDTCLKANTVEVQALRKVKHRRILEYIGYSRTKTAFFLFVPYIEKGSLANYFKCQVGSHLTEERTALFTSQILEGLDYLHKHDIIHRDIKASNILMKNENEIVISDFGVAKILNTLTKANTTGKGTTNWMAPEIIREEPHNSKADIWSLGCTVYQMITGKVPFNELTDVNMVKKALENELQLSFPDHLSPNLKDFLNRTCIKNPAERPNASELMQHRFITGQIKQEELLMKEESLTTKRKLFESEGAYAEDEMHLLLIGKSGNGKSSTGNMILGRSEFKEDSRTESVTKHVSTGVVKFEGRVIKVVDGPGVGDTVAIQDVEQAAELAINSMKGAITLSPKGYNAFLLVIRYGTRFTMEDFECIQLLKSIFGEMFLKLFCILVVTHGDVFYSDPKNKEKSFETWCREQTGVFKDLLTECNNRVVLFDNQSKDPDTRNLQVATLLSLVDDHGGKRYSLENYFRYTESSRKIILVKAKEHTIKDDVMNTLGMILRDYNDIKYTKDLKEQKSLTTNLILKIEKLSRHLINDDNGTGTFQDLITRINQIRDMFEDKSKSISGLLQVNYTIEKVNKERQEQQEILKKKLDKLIEQQNIETKKLEKERKIIELESREKEKEIKKQLKDEEERRNKSMRTETQKHKFELEMLQKEKEALKENKELSEKEREVREQMYIEKEQQSKDQFDSIVNKINSHMEVEKKNAERMLQLEKENLQIKLKELTDKYNNENQKYEQLIQNTTTENENLNKKLEETKQKKKQLKMEYQKQCMLQTDELHKKDIDLTEKKGENDVLLYKLQQAEEAIAESIESKIKELKKRYLNDKNSITEEEKKYLKKEIDDLMNKHSVLQSNCCII